MNIKYAITCFLIVFSIEMNAGQLKKSLEKLSNDLQSNGKISEDTVLKLFTDFDAENRNIVLKIQAVPLMRKIDEKKFLQFANKYILDSGESVRLKAAFWKELLNQLTLNPKINPTLDKYVENLIEKVQKKGWTNKQDLHQVFYFESLIKKFKRFIKNNPQVSKEKFQKFRSNLLLPPIERWKRTYISNHKTDYGMNIITISSMPGGTTSIRQDQKYIEALVDLLSHPDDGVSMAAALDLRRNTGQNFGFNPVGTEAERRAAIKKWQDYIRAHDVFKEKFEAKKKKFLEMRKKRKRTNESSQ